MMQTFQKATALLLMAVITLSFAACGKTEPIETASDAAVIVLNETEATFGGKAVPVYDYAWHCDPTTAHDEVKNCPAEYYTGTAPDGNDAVYIAHDILYYPKQDAASYTKQVYDGETEWVSYYADGEHDDYLFATLPVIGETLPEDMMHTAEEAYANPVLHITKPGTYRLTGSWHGQILIDLGEEEDTFADPEAKVCLVLDGATVTCDVAPAVLATDLYECDNGWEDRTEATAEIDTSAAGFSVILADGSTNAVTGTNVFRMLKTVYKNEEDTAALPVQKKAHKYDGAFYSCVSMELDGGEKGTGSLTVTSTDYEGMDSELHLTVKGGNTTIYAQDDGINVNEDHVSVFRMTGGTLVLYAGLGAEGDGVDSNGYIRITGGTLFAIASPASDNGLDSEDGTEITGGQVLSGGSNMGGSSFSLFLDGEQQYTNRTGGIPQGDSGFKPDGTRPQGMPSEPPQGDPPAKPEGQQPGDPPEPPRGGTMPDPAA